VEGSKAIADRTMCAWLPWLWGLRITHRRGLMAGRLEGFSETVRRTGCLGYGVPGQQSHIKCHPGKSNRSSRAAILMQPTQAHVSSLVLGSASIQGAIRRRSVKPDRTQRDNVRYGSLAHIRADMRDVSFTPDSGHSSVQVRCPLSAMSGELFLVVADTANLISDLISTIGSGL
jgi:hypothetical protein